MPPTSFNVEELTLGGTYFYPSQLHTKSPYNRLRDVAACLISHALPPAPICHRWVEFVLFSAKRLVACVSGITLEMPQRLALHRL